MKPDQTSETPETDAGRRSFLKKTTYAVPAIITLTALPSFASAGSGHQVRDKEDAYQIIDDLSNKYPGHDDFWSRLRELFSNWW